MKSDISIIVPIYNAEDYVENCINSLINQTKTEIEIILINDGSTDSTDGIIRKYSDKRIKYFSNKNQGIGKTRNFGISKATSNYIMFCDSDDYYEPNMCEIMYDTAKKEDLDLVICDFYREYENGKVEPEHLPTFKYTNLEEMPSLIRTINLAPWNKLYKKSLLIDNNIYFEENLKYEDTPFVAKAIGCATRIGKVDKCLNHYLIREQSETTVRDRRCFDIIKIIDIVRSYYKGKRYLKEDLDKLTVRVLTNYTIQQRVQIDPKVADEFIDEAFAYLKKEVPDYKNKKYYENRSAFKRKIEKSKFLTKIYCKTYQTTKRKESKK